MASWIAVGAAATTIAGLGASHFIRSPQQVAADARPPAVGVLTAVVEKRVLRQTLVLRGEVVAGQTFEVTPSAPRDSKPVVTAVRVEQGDEIKPGQVIVEVGGRPLIALPGAKPAYRDLRPGYTGDDIRQLQFALKSLGHNPREYDGVFGSGTKRALAALYARIGFRPMPSYDDEEAQLAAARKQVTIAERALADAKDAYAAAPPEEKDAAYKVVVRATEDLADARHALADLTERTGPTLPLNEYVFLPSFPARIDGLKARTGWEVETPLVTLSCGELKVRAMLSPGQQRAVRPGMRVDIASEVLGIAASGTVESIGGLQTDDRDPTASGYPMTIAASKPLDRELAGQNVRLTLATATSDGEVLVVPVSALFAGADGQPSVVRRDADGREQRIAVAAGMSGDGYVAVTSLGDELRPGDRVVIGQEPGP